MSQLKVQTDTIINMLADGLTAKEIANKNNVNVFCISRRIERLRMKYGCKNITQLVVKLKFGGLIATS